MSEETLQRGETPATRRALAHLEALGIPYQRLEHEPVTTSEAAAGARGSRLAERKRSSSKPTTPSIIW
jgi:hypothetical protein